MFKKSRAKAKDGDVHVRILRYITDRLAKWEYLPIDSEGKIQKGNMTWTISGSEPDFLISENTMGGREPFFILRNDIAVPISMGFSEDDETGQELVKTLNPLAVTQLIDNQNLRLLTKIPIEKFSRAKIFLVLAVGIAFGLAVMFAVMKILSL